MNVVFALCEAATPRQIGGKKTRKNYFKFIFLYMKINSKLQIIVSLAGAMLSRYFNVFDILLDYFLFYRRKFLCSNSICVSKILNRSTAEGSATHHF